jgi:indole-3-glycerol phosphate synthase
MGSSQPGSGAAGEVLKRSARPPSQLDGRTTATILHRLLGETRAEIAARRAQVPEPEVAARAASAPPPRDFGEALRSPRLAVIAEMKASSPSAGRLVAGVYDPAALARQYAAGGASALSVLCQETSFGGAPEHLAIARDACRLPVLRKDFIVDEYQVIEARAYGADAVLLIVAALSRRRLADLLGVTRSQRMAAIVEVHDETEVAAALAAGANIIGVNHRDLRTLALDLGLTARLRASIPEEVTVVAESGIADRATARRLREAGADAVLVGEALLRAPDPAALIAEMASV